MRIRIEIHHHNEFFIIDLAIFINVCPFDFLFHVLLGDFLFENDAKGMLELLDGDEAVAILVESTENDLVDGLLVLGVVHE